MSYEKSIDRIIDKNFNQINRAGVGFLNTEINKCKTDLKELVKILSIQRREQLIAFEKYRFEQITQMKADADSTEGIVDIYLMSL